MQRPGAEKTPRETSTSLPRRARRGRSGLRAKMRYLGTVARVRGQWQATFPDAPGCQALADGEDGLPGKAKEAIEAWLTTFLVQGGTPPRIKRHVGPGLPVEVSPRLAFAVELRRARTEAGLTLPQLAEKAG